MSKYHLKHQGPQIDALLDKAGTALQEHQDISHLASFADLQDGLADKVDKVDGKSLSTEDFTTILKEKLESLSNYDDASIKATVQSLQTQLNTLVDGNATSAIDTFNEIIAFLSSVEDTESLSSIIASIEQQIADKQDKISDLDSIREGAAKGATAIQEHQQLKTINGESIVGSGDITIQGGAGGEGSGITIVDDVSKLDPNAALGTLAAVVEPGSIQESSFRDLYQPDASILDQTTGTLTQPELLSSVSSINFLTPTDYDGVEIGTILIPRTFSQTDMRMIQLMVVYSNGMLAGVVAAYINQTTGEQAEYIVGQVVDGVYTIDDAVVTAINDILASDDWCNLGIEIMYGVPMTEEQFATLDKFVTAVAGFPSKVYLYQKGDEWGEFLGETIKKLQGSINNKSDVIFIRSFYDEPLKPGVYYTKTNYNSGDITFTLVSPDDSSKYNEYNIELKCSSTPNSVSFTDGAGLVLNIKWANDKQPAFESGYTYIISIANGFGVFAEFIN